MSSKEPYSTIAKNNYQRIIQASSVLTNALLKTYIDTCFTDTLDQLGLYAAWCCTNCMKNDRASNGWGKHPNRCPNCGQPSAYQIATFNAWASPVGATFAAAVYFLLRCSYRLPIVETPGNTKTHDFEITSSFVIEAKGSPLQVANPDGSSYELGRPGMERSDTEKKAFANASVFKDRNPNAYFAVLTNALPPRLINYRNTKVNGIFNVTRVDQLKIFMRDVRDRVQDIDRLRNAEQI